MGPNRNVNSYECDFGVDPLAYRAISPHWSIPSDPINANQNAKARFHVKIA